MGDPGTSWAPPSIEVPKKYFTIKRNNRADSLCENDGGGRESSPDILE